MLFLFLISIYILHWPSQMIPNLEIPQFLIDEYSHVLLPLVSPDKPMSCSKTKKTPHVLRLNIATVLPDPTSIWYRGLILLPRISSPTTVFGSSRHQTWVSWPVSASLLRLPNWFIGSSVSGSLLCSWQNPLYWRCSSQPCFWTSVWWLASHSLLTGFENAACLPASISIACFR